MQAGAVQCVATGQEADAVLLLASVVALLPTVELDANPVLVRDARLLGLDQGQHQLIRNKESLR